MTYTYAPSVCPPPPVPHPHPFTAPSPTHLPLPDTPPGGEAGTGSVPADLEKIRFLSIWRQDSESPAPAAVPQSPDPVTPVVIKTQSHQPRGLLHSHPTKSPRRYQDSEPQPRPLFHSHPTQSPQSLSRLRVTSPGGCSTVTRPSHPVVIKARSHQPRPLFHSHPTQSPRRYQGSESPAPVAVPQSPDPVN